MRLISCRYALLNIPTAGAGLEVGVLGVLLKAASWSPACSATSYSGWAGGSKKSPSLIWEGMAPGESSVNLLRDSADAQKDLGI